MLVDLVEDNGEQASAQTPQANEFENADDIGSERQSSLDNGRHTLPLLQLADWSEDMAYDDHPPTCIHYSIEWKLTVNNKAIARDTEQDLVLAPNAYWDRALHSKLEKLLRKKLPPNKSFRADDTTVTVSITDRSERDLVKRFDELEIDWSVIERQLQAWSHLFRGGKKLRVDISFNYMETGPGAATSARQGTKRGYNSASQQMLSERAMQLDAEEETSGQPSIWRDIYNLMRCPGPPCSSGPHC